MAAVKKQSDEPDYRQKFIDATAQALFASGWPKQHIFTQAAMLWKLREEYLSK